MLMILHLIDIDIFITECTIWSSLSLNIAYLLIDNYIRCTEHLVIILIAYYIFTHARISMKRSSSTQMRRFWSDADKMPTDSGQN